MQAIQIFKKDFQMVKLAVQSMIGEGNQVAAKVESNGNHINGKKYENKYHCLIKIENGQMTEVKEYMGTPHLYQLIQP